MHVDKNWIKQRPHFLAEELSKNFNVFVFYSLSLRRKNLINEKCDFSSLPYLIPPFFFKSKIIRSLFSFFLKIFFKVVIFSFKPNFIWITSPFQFNFFFKSDRKILIYDCMDNHKEFFNSKNLKNEIAELEKNINKFGSTVFASSEHLLKKFSKNKSHLINNAFSLNWVNQIRGNINLSKSKIKNNNKIVLGYFGTISKWIDYDLLINIVKNNPQVLIKLIGPTESIPKKIYSFKSVQFLAPASHSTLTSVIKDIDIFIMPFKVNKLIQSVDPVKVYEYILLKKPVIVPWYSELSKFSSYIDFYNDFSEFNNYIREFLLSGYQLKYSLKDHKKFIKNNSWQSRANEINKILHKIV